MERRVSRAAPKMELHVEYEKRHQKTQERRSEGRPTYPVQFSSRPHSLTINMRVDAG